ncbi:MAG: membrane protein insertase YidC [Spirochaetes bacterium]|nr:membrane protein insertase YidC [Spirochaetota bacterium]
MNKNTVVAFVLSLAVLLIWTLTVRKKYQPSQEKNPPIFKGLKDVSYNESADTVTLSWDSAKDESEIYYLIYYSQNNKITNYETPAYQTKNTSIDIYDLDTDIPAYFAVRAVDQFNNREKNTKQILFRTKKSTFNENLVKVETPLARYVLSTLGGRLKYLVLKKYRNITDKSNVNLVLYPKKRYAKNYTLGFTLLKNGEENFIANDLEQYSVSRSGTNIIFSGSTKEGINVTKKYIFHNHSYLIGLDISLSGSGSSVSKYRDGFIVLKWQPFLGPVDEKSRYNILQSGYFGMEKLNEIKYSGGGLFSKKYNHFGKVISKKEEGIDYVTFHNRYFICALLPLEKYRIKKVLFYSDGDMYIGGIASELSKNFFKNGHIDYHYSIYAGPKLRDTFRSHKFLSSLEKTIGFRKIISPIGNFFLDVLRFFNSLVGNWGISIIIFTFLLKGVLYPLTHKQFESMARMQKLQPLISQLKEQYKSEPQKMNQELMKVYKKHKVNPFGGCLPLLLQIPVFLAMWDMLQYSLELRDASFLWIKSLALPDTVAVIAGIPINPLPAVMGASMFLQQKISSTDPQHKMTMYLMPAFFLFIFWNMPSGLVLYWTIQNFLSIIQQSYLNKKMGMSTGGKNESH